MGCVWLGSPTLSDIWQFSSTAVKTPSESHERKSPLASPWGAHLTGSVLWGRLITMPAGLPGRIMVSLLNKGNPVPWESAGYQNNAHASFSILSVYAWGPTAKNNLRLLPPFWGAHLLPTGSQEDVREPPTQPPGFINDPNLTPQTSSSPRSTLCVLKQSPNSRPQSLVILQSHRDVHLGSCPLSQWSVPTGFTFLVG